MSLRENPPKPVTTEVNGELAIPPHLGDLVPVCGVEELSEVGTGLGVVRVLGRG